MGHQQAMAVAMMYPERRTSNAGSAFDSFMIAP
jgi:hypothetical protein